MKNRFLFTCLLLLYCLLLVSVLFIRDNDGLGTSLDAISQRLNERVNLQPFHTIKSYHSAYLKGSVSSTTYFINIYGNILLFMPLGAILMRIFNVPCRIIKCMAALSVAVLSAELIQLIFGIGRCDIDDIILNLGGAVLSCFLHSILKSSKKNKYRAKLT